jgi:hypothetical protein
VGHKHVFLEFYVYVGFRHLTSTIENQRAQCKCNNKIKKTPRARAQNDKTLGIKIKEAKDHATSTLIYFTEKMASKAHMHQGGDLGASRSTHEKVGPEVGQKGPRPTGRAQAVFALPQPPL